MRLSPAAAQADYRAANARAEQSIAALYETASSAARAKLLLTTAAACRDMAAALPRLDIRDVGRTAASLEMSAGAFTSVAITEMACVPDQMCLSQAAARLWVQLAQTPDRQRRAALLWDIAGLIDSEGFDQVAVDVLAVASSEFAQVANVA